MMTAVGSGRRRSSGTCEAKDRKSPEIVAEVGSVVSDGRRRLARFEFERFRTSYEGLREASE